MKIIRQEDIYELNDVIMELPAFVDLKSKESIDELLTLFLKDIYIEKPKELFDTFDFKLSEKMQSTFFRNYGIDEDYACNLMGYVKTDIAYSLEKLFQNKGSNNIFKFLATILESVFPKINFYNIEVHKNISENEKVFGQYIFSYKLDPIYIQDDTRILTEPGVEIGKSRKYLMDLKNFAEYTVWPVPTNLVYIQFNSGTDLINNLNTFLNGIRSYGTTYLSGLYFNYLSSSRSRVTNEKIEASDLEFIVSFFQLNMLKETNPEWDFTAPNINGSYLSLFKSGSFARLDPETDTEYLERVERLSEEKCSFMNNAALLFRDYQSANYADREDMEDLRRRWQFFLRAQETQDICYNTLDELNQEMENRYPRLSEDFWASMAISFPKEGEDQVKAGSNHKNKGIYTFLIKLYSIFLNGANSSFNQPQNKLCFPDYNQPRQIQEYIWRDESGDILSTKPNFIYTPIKIGAKTLTLTVENIDGFVDSDTITILSTDGGYQSPSIGIDKNKIVRVGTEVRVDAFAETTPGEVIEGYEWWLDNRIIKTSVGISPTFFPTRSKKIDIISIVNETKDYDLELKVWDSTGNANYNKITIRSIKEETPEETYPQAYAGSNLRGVVGEPIHIVGSGEDIEIIKIHNTEWILTYIDVVFGNLFLSKSFKADYLHPIMDLFQRYFLPVELDHIADLGYSERIKDKWNSISTSSIPEMKVIVRKTSLQTPIRGLDRAFSFIRLGNKHSYLYLKDTFAITDL